MNFSHDMYLLCEHDFYFVIPLETLILIVINIITLILFTSFINKHSYLNVFFKIMLITVFEH